jgi:hypothetical protein
MIGKLFATPGVQLIIYKMLSGEKPINIHKEYIRNKFFPSWVNELRAKYLDFKGRHREA